MTTRWRALNWTLIALTVAGLVIDAYVHLDLAKQYDPIASTTLSQGDLFRAEAIASIVAAAALLLRPRRYTAALAALVAGTGAAALIVYRYWNVRSFGPIPRMYEPVWFTEKTTAAVAEIAATFVALVLLVALPPRCDDDQPAQDEDHHRSRLARPV